MMKPEGKDKRVSKLPVTLSSVVAVLLIASGVSIADSYVPVMPGLSGGEISKSTTHKPYAPACNQTTDDFDLDLTQGNFIYLDLEDCDQAANDLNAPTGMVNNAAYTICVETNTAGTYDLTFNAVFLFPGGTAPVQTQTADAIDCTSCLYINSKFLCSFGQDYQAQP